jgi:two-component system, cell cycle sensor histidine kinase and response regulator CckA
VITKNTGQDEELKKSQLMYRNLFENEVVGIYRSKLDGSAVLEVNQALCDKLGYTREEMLSETPPTLWTDPKAREEFVRQLITDGSVLKYEADFITKSGEIIHSLLSAKLYPQESYIEGLAIDITERKQVAEALRKSEERYRALVEKASDVVFRTDNSGHFTFVNPAAIRISGYSEEEIIGEHFSKYIPRNMKGKVIRLLVSQREQRVPNTYLEFPILSKQGHKIWIGQNTQLIVEDGNVVGFQAVARDITELKQMEKEKAKLEKKNQQLQKFESLNRMAGAVAHHFNNQLQGVTGFLSLALYDNMGKDRLDLIKKALKATGTAAEMSGLMLIYLGQDSSKREPLDLSEKCRRYLPILNRSMMKNIAMEVDFPSTGPIVNADEAQIIQILTNLVTNAKEAIDIGGGSIKLRIKTVSLAEIPKANRFPIDFQLHDQSYACLEVNDTGHGITDTDIEKLFDPFFSTKFTGRGLGLAVVLGIVRAHKGFISVESKLGCGSAFRVFLPVSS